MDSRVLIRIAAPVALTFLVMLAVGLDWPTAVTWGALVAMTAAWLAFAWSVSHSGGKQVSMVREQTRVLEELRTFVTAEIGGSHAGAETDVIIVDTRREAVGGRRHLLHDLQEDV